MLRRHFKSPADVVQHYMAEIIPASVLLGEEVAAYAAAYIYMLDAGQGCDLAVKVDERTMVGLEVSAEGGHRATIARTTAAEVGVLPFHAPHVGRWAAEVGDDTVEVVALHDGLHLAEDGGLAATGYLLALVRRNGAEGTTAKASTVDVHRSE